MDTTVSVVRPNDTFMTRVQAAALINVCDDVGFEFYERYMWLRHDDAGSRHMLDHDEAMIVLIEDVLGADCFRLKAAGGKMQEIADLSETIFEALDEDAGDAIAAYIDLRCRLSMDADKAFSRICKQYKIDEEKYSAAKRRDAEALFSNL